MGATHQIDIVVLLCISVSLYYCGRDIVKKGFGSLMRRLKEDTALSINFSHFQGLNLAAMILSF